ncbi:hypothetical protein [Phormidesmis priestleyi]
MSQKELLPNLDWEFQRLDNGAEISDGLLDQLLQVCVDGFGLKSNDWVNDNREMLSTSTLFGKLTDDQGYLYGIAFYSAPDMNLGDSHILWEDGICLVKELQHKGFSRKAIAKAISLFPERQFNWLGCRTQNPAMMMRYSKFGRLFPFDKLYDSADGQPIMEFLIEHIAEVRTTYQRGKLNTINGVCTRLYPQGRLGDYLVDLERAAQFEKQLQSWEFQRARGDAVILVSSLVQRMP